MLQNGFARNKDQITRNIIITLCKAHGNKNIVVINPYKRSKLLRLFTEKELKKIKFIEINEPKVIDNYYDCYRRYKKILKDNQIEEMYIFNVLTMHDFKPIIRYEEMRKGVNVENYAYESCSTFLNKMFEMKEKYTFDNFVVRHTIFRRFCYVLAAYEVCNKIYHLVQDTNEINLDYVMKDVKNAPDEITNNSTIVCPLKYRDGVSYLPFFEYQQFYNSYTKKTKTIDFIFTAVCNIPSRLYVLNKKPDMEKNNESGIWKVNIVTKVAKTVTQETYYQSLSKSYFTFILKSPENTFYDMFGFFEALFCGCIPIIEKDASTTAFKQTYKDLYEVVMRYDLFSALNSKSIGDKIEALKPQYDAILADFMACKSIEKLTDIKYIRDTFNEFYTKGY